MPADRRSPLQGHPQGLLPLADENEPLRLGDAVIVEAERGRDLGRVTAVGDAAAKKCGGVRRLLRPASKRTARHRGRRSSRCSAAPARRRSRQANELRRQEDEIRREVAERVRAHDLAMKVSDTEWQWDRKKLTIYFTAEKRVDFRALVRDLAATFRTRIELRQIGVRDEAARLAGVGRCGREYCCSHLAHGALAGQPGPGQGPAPLAQPRADLRRLRPAALLPQVRARVLRRRAEALPQGREDAAHRARAGEGRRGRHLPRAGLPPAARAGSAHHRCWPSSSRRSRRSASRCRCPRSVRARAAGPAPPRPRRADAQRRPRGARPSGSAGAGASADGRRARRGAVRPATAAALRPPRRADGAFYLTTAIDYSNGDPHLGHALEKVGADCIARYRRLRGDEVHFLMGMDEHSQAVIAGRRAERRDAAGVGRRHGRSASSDFWSRLECSNDDWIRTTEPRHVAGVTALLRADPAAESRRPLRGRVRGALLHRLRGVQEPTRRS